MLFKSLCSVLGPRVWVYVRRYMEHVNTLRVCLAWGRSRLGLNPLLLILKKQKNVYEVTMMSMCVSPPNNFRMPAANSWTLVSIPWHVSPSLWRTSLDDPTGNNSIRAYKFLKINLNIAHVSIARASSCISPFTYNITVFQIIAVIILIIFECLNWWP
jgi:hypothetical protein